MGLTIPTGFTSNSLAATPIGSAGLTTSIINALGGVTNGQISNSDSWNTSDSESSNGWNESSFSDSWNQSDSYSDSEATGRSIAENESYNESQSGSQSTNKVYGSEASAKDIIRAAEANAEQWKLLEAQMQYNSMEAEKARAWEEAMSNSSYQRAVKDLRAAGLNPILAAMNMGASTPVAAYGSSGLASAYKANTFVDEYGQSSSYGYSTGGSKGYSKSTYDAKSHSESHSSGGSHSESSGSGGGSSKSHSEGGSHSESKPALVKGITDMITSGTEAIKKMYEGGGGKSAFDNFNNPTVSH